MSLNINEISAGRQYEHKVSGVTAAGKKEPAEKNLELLQMKDTVSTSSWARIASGALCSVKDEVQMFRPDKVEQFKFLSQENVGGGPVLTADKMADSVFSRLFG